MGRYAAAVALWVAGVGCAGHGVVDDGTSVSYGTGNLGALQHGVPLPVQGDGYWVPPRWEQRGNLYGTEELVATIVRVGRRLAREQPSAAPLGVADLSPLGGGPSRHHRSHQSGRDVDLLFFARDANGAPVVATDMYVFGADGMTRRSVRADGSERARLYFDVARNWALIRALMEATTAEVQYIFIYEPLRRLLLAHARATGEPPALVEQAAQLLHQPSDSAPHWDHMHVRVFCAPSDRPMGCRDRGLLRWKKKGYKYEVDPRWRGDLRDQPVADAAAPGVFSRSLRAAGLRVPMQFRHRLHTSEAR
jgi:penicillin-insensitive murein DD-endopeptidase